MQGTEQMQMGAGESHGTNGTGKHTHPEVARNGRRPRWAPEEDRFLIDALRKGMKPREVVGAYQKSKFGKVGRPDNGVFARIDAVKALAKLPAQPEAEVAKEGAKGKASTYGAAASICEILQSYDTQDRRRIMTAVASLMDTDEPSTH